MNHLTIIKRMQADGLSLSLTEEGRIDVAGDRATIERWLPLLREHKPDIFAALSAATVSDLTHADELAVRHWVAEIEEGDPLMVEQVIFRCRVNPDARQYFLMRSAEVPQGTDNRRFCTECANLNKVGYCEAAERGEINGAGARYRPWQGLPRRCDRFLPI